MTRPFYIMKMKNKEKIIKNLKHKIKKYCKKI